MGVYSRGLHHFKIIMISHIEMSHFKNAVPKFYDTMIWVHLVDVHRTWCSMTNGRKSISAHSWKNTIVYTVCVVNMELNLPFSIIFVMFASIEWRWLFIFRDLMTRQMLCTNNRYPVLWLEQEFESMISGNYASELPMWLF